MIAVLLPLLAAGPAVLPERRAPVRVDADEVRYLYPKREAIFTGKPTVRLTQGDAVLTCRRLVATNDAAGRIEKAVCTGDVRFARGARIVTCETATFENGAGRVTCEGNPVLRDGATVAHGERLVYELATDEVTLLRPVIELPPDEVEARRKDIEARRPRGEKQ